MEVSTLGREDGEKVVREGVVEARMLSGEGNDVWEGGGKVRMLERAEGKEGRLGGKRNE